MTQAQARPPFVLKGWHVLAALLLFFGGDIAVNTVFLLDAYRSYPGEAAVTPYEDGLAYNTALKQRLAQEALGWRITAGAVQGGALRTQVMDRAGLGLHGLRVSGQLQRPATETGSRIVAFHEIAAGVYDAPAAALHGAWDLDLTVIDAQGRKALAQRRLVLP